MSHNWDDAAVTTLRDLNDAGLSSSQIANELGCSRNAVIGKIHRMGMKKSKHSAGRKPQAPAKPKDRDRRIPVKTAANLDFRIKPHPKGTVACSLLELTDRTCRFPISGPEAKDFLFCGNMIAAKGAPYCAFHTRLAYTSPATRRADSAADYRIRYNGTQT
jgi:GcrA cell cycle regulator